MAQRLNTLSANPVSPSVEPALAAEATTLVTQTTTLATKNCLGTGTVQYLPDCGWFNAGRLIIRKVGLLRVLDKHPLAGKMTGLLHLGSQLPVKIWFDERSTRPDQTFGERIITYVTAGSLLLFDLGYTNFTSFQQITPGRYLYHASQA